MEKRYQRHIQIPEIGTAGQKKLAEARVLVVGAGGLGCPVLQYLSSSGVGCIGIVDPDTVETSNLARQILFCDADVSKNKAICAMNKLTHLNPDTSLKAYPVTLTHENALELINQYDIVVDGTDNFSTRYLISDSCVLLNKVMVYGGLYKYEGQVGVFNYNGGPTYRCLFPTQPQLGEIPDCSETGTLSVVPGVIGLLQATEVLKIILGLGDLLSGRLLCLDLMSYEQRFFHFKKNKAEIQRVIQNKVPLASKLTDCVLDFEVTLNSLSKKDDIQWIDVREQGEEPKINIKNTTSLPGGKGLELTKIKIQDSKKILFCKSGIRSKSILQQWKSQGIKNCFYLKEGAERLNKWYKTDEG